MKARVKWVDGVMFIGEAPSGHAIIMDGAPESGGRNMGVRPMEMLLLGMGGCSSFDVVGILRKARADLVDCVVELEAERAEDVPKVFTRIHAHYVVSGRGLKEATVKRAVDLSVQKYCSASIMLGKTAAITHDFEIVEVE
ncbi:MAG: OsmC family protein [Rhodospirillaceae bacterium]|nr:OsmC family protein [Rhodospirillaceae bacterium]